MTDEEQLEAVLVELRALLREFRDLRHHVVLVGAQVLALEARRLGRTGAITVETPTGVVVGGRFSFEPDLLLDVFDAVTREMGADD